MVANVFINALQATWDDANTNHKGIKLTVYNLASNTESRYFEFCLDSNSSPKMWGRIDGVYFGNGYFTGNSTANLFANSTLLKVANSTYISNLQPGLLTLGGVVVNTSQIMVGANVVMSTIKFQVGNSTANAFVTTTDIRITNSTGQTDVEPGLVTVGGVITNSSAIAIGANVILNTTSALVGNSTANLFANSILVKVANSTGIANLQPGLLTIGTSVVNSTVISATNLKFGTHAALAAETVSGYITVTDAGGTPRKLAVVS